MILLWFVLAFLKIWFVEQNNWFNTGIKLHNHNSMGFMCFCSSCIRRFLVKTDVRVRCSTTRLFQVWRFRNIRKGLLSPMQFCFCWHACTKKRWYYTFETLSTHIKTRKKGRPAYKEKNTLFIGTYKNMAFPLFLIKKRGAADRSTRVRIEIH